MSKRGADEISKPAPAAQSFMEYTRWRLGAEEEAAQEATLKKAKEKVWEPRPVESDDFAYEDDLLEEAMEAMVLEHQEDPFVNAVVDELQMMDVDGNFLSERYLLKDSPYKPSAYERPPPHPLGEGAGELFTYQHSDTTYGLVNNQLEVRLWGITADGHSVLTRVQGFVPYFFVNINNEHDANLLRQRLEVYLDGKFNGSKPKHHPFHIKKFVVAIEQVLGRNFCGYHMNVPMGVMYKFYMARPAFIGAARDCFDYVNRAVCNRKYETYEGNIEYELRYMIDAKINGCEWLEVPPLPRSGGGGAEEGVNFVSPALRGGKISSAQYEFLVQHKDNRVKAIPSAQKGDLAPMRILSYDIEVRKKGQGFPTAEKDPCIMICAALQITGKGIVHQVAFLLRPPGDANYHNFKTDDGQEVTVYVYHNERDMICAFSQYIQACDPEALTGWNISNFDLPYLAKRAKLLGVFDSFMSFSRILDKPVWIRQKTFQSKAYGAKTSNEMLCEGRFDHDGLTFMLRGQMEKYRSYKLNYIAKKVIGDEKHDVDHTQIPILYDGSDEDRTRLASYCTQDALLPLKLLDKLMAMVNGIEQARVTGVPQRWLLEKGQGKKTQSNLLRYKQPGAYVPSRSAKSNTQVTGGGYVKEPKRGFYRVPLASLDFASLYPSIMIAYNICFSTKVSLKWARENLKPDDYWIPNPAIDKKTAEQLAEEQAQREEEERAGVQRKKKNKVEREREEFEQQFAGQEPNFCFVKRHIMQGTLPRLLETLLETRRNVKAMMKGVNPKTDPIYYAVLDGRQLALKVVCNSVCKFEKKQQIVFFKINVDRPQLMAF